MTRREYYTLLAEQERRAGRQLLWGARILCDQCSVTVDVEPEPAVKRRELRPRSIPKAAAKLSLTPAERDDYGVTVTIRDQDTGALDTIVGHGPVREALSHVCERIDERGGHWKVLTVSSPATIFTDLQGMRDPENAVVDLRMLSQVGRSDLYDDGRLAA